MLLPGARARRRRAARGARRGHRRLRAAHAPSASASKPAAPIPTPRSPIPRVRLVFVATRHDIHAELAEARAARRQGRLAREARRLSLERGRRVVAAARETRRLPRRRLQPPLLAARARHARGARRTGAGRSPSTTAWRPARRRRAPGSWTRTWAAGASSARSATSWTCAAFSPARRRSTCLARALGRDPERDDSLVALLGFADGSTATIEYLAQAEPRASQGAHRGFGRRRDRALRELPRDARSRDAAALRSWNQDKGQAAAVARCSTRVRRGAASPFDLDEIAAVSRATFAMLESCRSGRTVELAR